MRCLSIAAIAATSAIAFTQFASAADLPVKAPVRVAAPVYSWTGCYVGLNAGGVWGHMDDDWTPAAPNAAGFTAAVASVLQTNGTGSMDGAGFTGGGQVGCNWQSNSFVWGAEADIQYTGLDGSRDVFFPGSGTVNPLNFHEDFQSRWLATFRGRLGWLINPAVLVYGTGGLAVADVDTTDRVVDATIPADFNAVSGSETRLGWTVGGGVEWMFMPRWSVKAEYLYVDLGSFSTTSPSSNPAFPLATIANDHHLTENIVRVGVNYKFY